MTSMKSIKKVYRYNKLTKKGKTNEVNRNLYEDNIKERVGDYQGTEGSKSIAGIQMLKKLNDERTNQCLSMNLELDDQTENSPPTIKVCNKKNLRKQRFHHGVKLYSCGICDKTFRHRSNCYRHKKIHSGVKPHSCSICGKSFLLKHQLQNHEVVHSAQKNHECEKCDKSFTERSSLLRHMKIHAEARPHICAICGKSFGRNDHLESHILTHSGEKNFGCGICNKSFAQKQNLLTHQRIHIGEKPYKCEVCQKSFTQSYNLRSHQRIHTGEKTFSCKICHKSFIRSSNLKRHQKTHTGKKSDTCSLKYVTQKNELIETPVVGDPHSCEVCELSFSEKSDLIRHKQIHEEGVQKTPQEIRNVNQAQESENSREHFSAHEFHNKQNAYQCEMCKKSFTQKVYLQFHQRIHTGQAPYQCEVCKKSFSQKVYLEVHKKSHI